MSHHFYTISRRILIVFSAVSSLIKDATELAKCVSYFKNFKAGKIVLIGHSTGCQDVMEYLTGPGHEGRPIIDGGIIQAPASDREAFGMVMDPDVLRHSNAVAQKMVDSGAADEIRE
jgi:predicted alpha/beta hydrolase family esterase